MDTKLGFVYVSSTPFKELARCCADRIILDLNINVEAVDTLRDIIPLITSRHYNVDYVVIDAESLIEPDAEPDIFDMIVTLSSLTKSSNSKKSTKVVVIVNDQTDVNLIKKFVNLPNIILALKIGGKVTYDMMLENVRSYTNGDHTVPSIISEMLKKDKINRKRKKQIYLTPRQQQIYHIVCQQGCSNKIIAKKLGITESTVKLHISTLLRKVGVKSRTQLAAFAKV